MASLHASNGQVALLFYTTENRRLLSAIFRVFLDEIFGNVNVIGFALTAKMAVQHSEGPLCAM
jgi:hypothetical protein